MIPFRDDVPAKRYPVTTVGIIVLNAVVFLYQLSLPQSELKDFIYTFGLVSVSASRKVTIFPLSLFTSIFLHGGWFHLFGNMWYLWIFGDNIEDRMGHFRFLFFYLGCGLAGGLVHLFFSWQSQLPSIGASGAVAGVLGAYLISYPFARILTIIPLFLFWPIIELPAILVLGSWFLVQLLNSTAWIAASSSTAGGVAWWAHVGGFITGLALIGLFARRPPLKERRREGVRT